jgi:hypothetical protein
MIRKKTSDTKSDNLGAGKPRTPLTQNPRSR